MVRVLFVLAFLFGLVGCKDTSTKYNPMLWEIQTIPPSYIFGTYHTKDPKFIPPDIVFEKLKKSQRLYTEILLEDDYHKEIEGVVLLANPIKLEDRVSSDTLVKIESHLYELGSDLSIDGFSSFNLWAIAMVLSNEPERIEYKDSLVMDEMLVKKAQEYGVQTGALEEFGEQIEFLQDLNMTQQENLINYVIDSHKFKDDIQRWYKSGNPDGVVELTKKVSSEQYILMEPMRYVRNETMARRIDILLETKPSRSYFFAIGAGHLGEADGIIEKLRQKGYKIKKLP